ncbi:hypothetical protein ES707_13796 [subsurface metagenome]
MDDIEKLQDYEERRNKRKLPQQFKPCVLEMLDTCLIKGENSFQRGKVALIIAAEYLRLGKPTQKTDRVLSIWNNRNDPPLHPSDINNAIRDAPKYIDPGFGCNNDIMLAFCDFEEDKTLCPYYRKMMESQGRKSKARHRESHFYSYGWPIILKQPEILLYLSLRQLEKLDHNKKAGQTIVTPYRLLVRYSGVHIAQIKASLIKLRRVGLIKVRIGEPYLWKVKATEITRIIPIPRPGKELKKRKLDIEKVQSADS